MTAKTSGGAKNWSKLPNAAKASGAGGGGELSAPYPRGARHLV